MQKQFTVNREHKDKLFRFLFKEKKELLSLYNAVNNSCYTDEGALAVKALDNVIYMNMKNDLSFLIHSTLNLYEHQSTWNPNMPLRDLIYITALLKGYVEEHGYDLYGSRLILLPAPQAVVFYNGVGDRPERQTLKLSQAFEASGAKPCLEFECTVLNINYGKNKELLGKCQTLMGYAKLIDKIRRYESYGRPLADAIDQAIGECIKENILSGFLKPYRSEVTNMILEEYDEQKHIENEKRWSFEDGQELINRLNAQLIKDNRIEDLKLSCVNPKVQQRLLLEYGLSV